jgi:hypothetical protein
MASPEIERLVDRIEKIDGQIIGLDAQRGELIQRLYDKVGGNESMRLLGVNRNWLYRRVKPTWLRSK